LLNEIASHLIHNAIDHGIETIEKRTQNGKNPIAKIEINLSTAENILLFQIKDDGKGLDLEKITNRAKEKGLIAENQTLDEKEAIELIFTQGFSTSPTVSEISGRGVGLDAVNDLVESSGGRIEVETKLGKGTIFSVYLPQK
jgi:two-component system chemotaxis sensor kinase CheA